jgi:hypothetical protein
VLLLASVPVSLLALAQGFGAHWAHRFGVTLTGVDLGHLDRATGPFTNWQVLAGYLLAIGLITVAVWAYRAESILPSRIAALLALLSGAALARTLTIGALAGLIIGSVVLVLSGREIRLSGARVLAIAIIAVVVLGSVLAARYHQEFGVRPGQASNGLIPNTLVDRVHNWTRQYLPALSGRWVTGFGPDLPPNASWKFTDSVYVTLVLRGGILLVAAYVALMAGFVSAAKTARLGTPDSRASAAAILVLIVVLVPLQAIANYFTTSGLPEVIWISAALLSIAPAVGRTRLGS